MNSDSSPRKEVLAIIPARGGSKGIPRKNIVDLCGKPLIAYAIETAINSHMISRVVVSTEDEEIAEIAKAYGAEVPFLRSQELAGDRSSLADAQRYTLRRLLEIGYSPEAVVLLMPTHVFRNPRLLNVLTSKLFEGYSQVKTVRPVEINNLSIFFLNGEKELIPLTLSDSSNNNGNKNVYFRIYGLYFASNQTGPQPRDTYLHYLVEPISLIDIDTHADLLLAEEVIKQDLFDFSMI